MNVSKTAKERRRYWNHQISLWQRSGLSKIEFARKHGFNPKKVYRWCKRLKLGKSFSDINVPNPEPSSSKASTTRTSSKNSEEMVNFVAVPLSRIPQKEILEKRLSLCIGRRFRILIPKDFSPVTLRAIISTLDGLE